MIKYFLYGFLIIGLNVFSQEKIFEKGKIIDSLTVNNSTDTYSLYLPSTYEVKKPSAVVYIFEPAARGRVGIGPFIAASEKYNYILVCSNNCKNGPYQDNFDRINLLFETVFNTFQINNNRVYTAGFSGGSRLATAVAVLTNQIQGVIGCGAGFPTYQPYVPSTETFSYVGLVGDEDMNYQEMFVVKDWFDKLNRDNELFTYDDSHNWPPSEQLLRAFDWLEIQSYKKGVKPLNDSIINEVFKSNYATAKLLKNNNKAELAVLEYERMIRNYSKYFDLDSIRAKVKELKKLKQYKKDVKTRSIVKVEETKLLNFFVDQFKSEFNSKDLEPNIDWWNKEFKKFQNKYLLSNNMYLKKMGERISFSLYAMLFETGGNQLRNNDINKALYCHNLSTVIFSERPDPFFRLAIDYALLNDEERMLKNLKLAIEKGFTNKEYMLNALEFSNYKNSEAFKNLANSF